ncbi:MAG: hypothetical protein M0R49_00075 [Limnochordia bacterium]|nr:hypothetical protein [Limnochordia bacterium]
MRDKKVDLFLDSGAFSAWSKGVQINIQEYIDFIKKHAASLTVYANLDVIGDPKATWKNQQIMEDAGLSPLPIFHYGEDIKWLDRYLSKGYDYLALGGMVPVSTAKLYPWLDRLFSEKLTDPTGMPIIKVHGFGLTSLRLMMRYPWYSVDSTSWVMTARMGSIYVPRYKGGVWNYGEDSWKIAVSCQSPAIKEAGKHFNTMPPSEQDLVIQYLSEKGYAFGKSTFRKESQSYTLKEQERWGEKKPKDKTAARLVETIEEEGVCNRHQLRDEVNILYFLALEKALPAWPWRFATKKSGGFRL